MKTQCSLKKERKKERKNERKKEKKKERRINLRINNYKRKKNNGNKFRK